MFTFSFGINDIMTSRRTTMLSFTEQEIIHIQQKAKLHPEFTEQLYLRNKDLMNKIYIQSSAVATWPHYYICPKCTVKLIYDYYRPYEYQCPVCSAIYTGEPYHGGWWAETAYKNAEGAFELAVLYLVTQDKTALETVKSILLGYAKHYPNYDVHGNIPYNHPGKMFAQVLDDAAVLNSYARAYDLICSTLTDDEQRTIIHGLFLTGAKHLMKYMTPQLHNHEVCICCALGNIGLVCNDTNILDFALNHKYGLKYQINHGFLDDLMWFEGSMGYHLYTLNWIFKFEYLARNTIYSLLSQPEYRDKIHRALSLSFYLAKEDGTFPKINDSEASFKGTENIYEYAANYFKDDMMMWCLNQTIRFTPRNHLYALLYGPDQLKTVVLSQKNYLSTAGSQLGIIRGSDHRFFLLKAAPYGGEHDHYDRLSISFSAFQKDVCADLGTASGYSAPLHYAYFKNTATHNTVVIDGQNMAPAATHIHEYKEYSTNNIYLDAQTIWTPDFIMPDSFTIKQWNEEVYQNVNMRRKIQCCDQYFIDVFIVHSPHHLSKDWNLHIDGTLMNNCLVLQSDEKLSQSTPHSHFHSVNRIKDSSVSKYTYDCDGFYLHVYPYLKDKEIITAKGPSNPAVKDISYLIERSCQKDVLFINVIEAARKDEEIIQGVFIEVTENEAIVHIKETSNQDKQYIFSSR